MPCDMKRQDRWTKAIVGMSVLGLGALAGCSPDPLAGGGGGDDDGRQEELGILCEASLSITGTFELGAAQPDDIFGCWPVGTWTFSASVVDTDCEDAPMLLPEYKFQVTRDAVTEEEEYEYLTEPGYERVRVGVSSGGGGLCEGSVEVYSLDGKTVVNLKPALFADGHLEGNGEFEVFGSDQW